MNLCVVLTPMRAALAVCAPPCAPSRALPLRLPRPRRAVAPRASQGRDEESQRMLLARLEVKADWVAQDVKLLRDEQLRHDFGGGEVAHQPLRAGMAEGASECAPHL